jgi:DNA-binding NarL/FixJ family response regulator
MEASLAGMDGLAATRRIRRTAPEVRVLIFSRDDREETQMRALQAGASGFVSKNVPVETVSRIVSSVALGEAAISRKMTMRLVERLRLLPEGGTGMRPVRSPLTAREWEVLDLLCKRKTTREIADALVLSEETIYSHSKNLLRKLQVHSRAEAVEAAEQLRQPVAGFATGPNEPDARDRTGSPLRRHPDRPESELAGFASRSGDSRQSASPVGSGGGRRSAVTSQGRRPRTQRRGQPALEEEEGASE